MGEANQERSGKRLLYVITEDWFFASHFLPMARAALSLGFDVAVVTRVAKHGEAIKAAGIRVIPVDFERGGTNPLAIAGQIRALTRVMRSERPSIVHCIALKSLVVGGFAARRAKVPSLVLAVTGLGHLWVSRSPSAAVGRGVIRWCARRLRGPQTIFLFENHDDPAAIGLDEKTANLAFMPGAGVDAEQFQPQPEPPSPPVRVAIVSRMLRAKGIVTAVEAMRRVRRLWLPVELDLWGAPDPSNPGSISEEQLRRWSEEREGITWRGPTDDVAAVWRQTHIALLPSHYREGLPRSLIEAMACGRPVITTDVPGCRELIRNGVEGLLVPKENPAAVAGALRRLATDEAGRRKMGEAALRRFREGYTTEVVAERIAEIYRSLA
jgi:glycosyltransferase involved in cell wall biosynthesis